MSCSLFVLTIALFGVLAPFEETVAQIPTACADAQSLETLTCCPTTADGVCGIDALRGACIQLDLPGYSHESSDVRVNWPHYFTQVCQCYGNYAGYDCSRCKPGYYGQDCSQKQILPRKPVRDLTEEDWDDFKNIIKLTRSYDSGYMAVLEESRSGNSSLVMTNISLNHLYTWIHHLVSREGVGPGIFLL